MNLIGMKIPYTNWLKGIPKIKYRNSPLTPQIKEMSKG
jgi:hypothetical protein